MNKTEIDAFVGDRWFITVRKGNDVDIDAVVKRWDRSADLAAVGVPYLLYGLLDVVADSYFKVLDQFDDYYERVSESLFDEQPLDPASQRDRFQARQSLVQIHRLVNGLREAVSSLLRRDDVVPTELDPYFQDVYDHLLRANEMTDTLRELVTQHRRDEPDTARLPPEPGHEAGHQLGRHHRRAHAHHRLLRHERAATPGINTTWGFLVSVVLLDRVLGRRCSSCSARRAGL